jgi:hypothetical protein
MQDRKRHDNQDKVIMGRSIILGWTGLFFVYPQSKYFFKIVRRLSLELKIAHISWRSLR